MFDAHGIHVVIGAEQHAGMLGGLGGAFVSLDIWVDADDAEEAAELLQAMRDSEPEPLESEEAGEDDAADAPDDLAIEARVDRRRRTGIALLLSCCITFGTGHMFSRAWLRGLMLAGLEIFAFSLIGHYHTRVQGAILFAAVVLTDMIGSIVRVRRAAPRIPRARIART
jgi:hypothetical protein